MTFVQAIPTRVAPRAPGIPFDDAPIPLDTGAPAFAPDPRLRQAVMSRLRTFGEGEYPPKQGMPALREAIACFHRTRLAIPDQAENIQITYGGMQALTDVLAAVLQPGDEVLLPAPYWYHFPRLIAEAGGSVKLIVAERQSGFKLTAQALEAAISPRTRMLVFTNPNNPTGSVHDRAEMNALAEVLARHPHVLILTDEVYNQLIFGVNGLSAVCPSLASWPGLRQRTFIVNSFSKNYALSGLRIGYISAQEEWIGLFTERQRFSTLGVNPLIQEQALALLLAQPAVVPPLVERLRRRRDKAYALVRQIPDLHILSPQAGYYFFADARAWLGARTPDDLEIDSDMTLADWLNREARVAVQTGSECGAPGFLRLTFAVPEGVFREGIKRLAAGLGKLKK
ncbi:MAG: aminotransferase class I/II-fold pyridoxal phosphate-dependent enzyme [Acidobacteriota bacterium]|nr:aminotransferase class I/II-fold pyridoxal phosphate-dependent enzyme [Acidobacteriota bacterium]